MKKLVIVPVLFLALTACKHKDKMVTEKQVANNVTTVQDKSPEGKVETNAESVTHDKTLIEKKVVKEGDITFETDNVLQTRKVITSSVNKSGGYISEEIQSNSSDENRMEYTIRARIPANNFDKFVDDVSNGAKD
jgi:hypothetical protein